MEVCSHTCRNPVTNGEAVGEAVGWGGLSTSMVRVRRMGGWEDGICMAVFVFIASVTRVTIVDFFTYRKNVFIVLCRFRFSKKFSVNGVTFYNCSLQF